MEKRQAAERGHNRLESRVLVSLALWALVGVSGCGGPVSPTVDLFEHAFDLGDFGDALAPSDGTLSPDATSDCQSTPGDCGPRGACVSCVNSSLGHQCVNTRCGCVAAADCDPGRACVGGECKTKGCDAMTACNGGCCDHGNCVSGAGDGHCGSDGAACEVCGAGTPSCQSGVCTATCVAGAPGASGVCGMGFCCGQNDQCQSVADAACGAVGALCTDCSLSSAGSKCLNSSVCGCKVAQDCQKGQACKAGVCGAACDANSSCNGGCCAGGACVDGTRGGACALGAEMCGSCIGNPAGAACVTLNNQTVCGCDSQIDCPANTACDPQTRICSPKCDANSPCNGGCCANGMCAQGGVIHACGSNGGACLDCAGNANGFVCVPVGGGGHCGCGDVSQCPVSTVACDPNAKICNHVCSAKLKCQVGCCTDANAGTCVNGASGSACGASGLCVDCTVLATGHACRGNQQCGCDSALDCPLGQSCNPVSHACGTSCGLNQLCNGACCSGGTCAPGSDGKACGSQGGACVDCSPDRLGHACLNGSVCGCSTAADCGPLQSCNTLDRVCTNACSPNQLCNGGCCLGGACVDGSANSACGASGAACGVCGGANPTCDGAHCGPQCGAEGNGICDGGNCCKMGACVPGTTSTACGFSGACGDCSGSPSGTHCIQPMGGPFVCGCVAKGDCRPAAAQQNASGQACDTSMNVCTSQCGDLALTGCNGGCCGGARGQCRPGNLDTSCGVSGGFCSDCTASCNPGPTCNPQTGACGCASLADCFETPQCQFGGAQREACSIPNNACCIPAWFNGTQWEDAGNPANCCTGQSVNGRCTCIPTGQPSLGDPAKCCSQHDQGGSCSCLPIGAPCVAESDTNGECCSGQCFDTGAFSFHCIASTRGQPCQSNLGCAPPLTCANNVCG